MFSDTTLLSTPNHIQHTLSQSESGAFLVDSTPIHSSVLLPVPSWRRSTLPTINWEQCLSSPSPTHKRTYDEMQDDIEMLKYDKQMAQVRDRLVREENSKVSAELVMTGMQLTQSKRQLEHKENKRKQDDQVAIAVVGEVITSKEFLNWSDIANVCKQAREAEKAQWKNKRAQKKEVLVAQKATQGLQKRVWEEAKEKNKLALASWKCEAIDCRRNGSAVPPKPVPLKRKEVCQSPSWDRAQR